MTQFVVSTGISSGNKVVHFVTGDMFDRDANVRVNTVNCVGVMGTGVALQFKKRYPAMFSEYRRKCRRGEIQPGVLHVCRVAVNLEIVNLPTKRHWKNDSRYEDVEAGLRALREHLVPLGRVHVTLPALGCGNGGLEWGRVWKMIEEHLGESEAQVWSYVPQDSRR